MDGCQIDRRTRESFEGYVLEMFSVYSKIMVVRFDIGYVERVRDFVMLDDIKRDVGHLLANTRGKPSLFQHMVGYIIKFEFGVDKGLHAHVVLFYDGQNVRKDEYLSMQVGKYWCDVITKGDGEYHSCNVNKDAKYDKCGIGMIDHTDSTKRGYLMSEVLSYLLKEKQSVAAFKKSRRVRAIVRGVMPQARSNAGRPRLE